jgi:adenylate cyclase class 2
LNEREIKIPVADLDPVRERLQVAGAEPQRLAGLESNLVFDLVDAPAERRLRSRRELLRLRSDGGGTRLTFKSAPRFVDGVKERLEHEFAVDDPAAARLLLESLGFGVAVRYEKVRETWRLLGCEVALDRTPMGDFVEVEELADDVPRGRIGEVCRLCGLQAERSVPEDYLALYRAFRSGRPDLPRDMVFSPGAE